MHDLEQKASKMKAYLGVEKGGAPVSERKIPNNVFPKESNPRQKKCLIQYMQIQGI